MKGELVGQAEGCLVPGQGLLGVSHSPQELEAEELSCPPEEKTLVHLEALPLPTTVPRCGSEHPQRGLRWNHWSCRWW